MTHTEEVVCPVTTMKEIYAGLHAYFQRWVEDESADYKPKVTMQFETRLIGIAKSTITKWDAKGHLPTSFRVGPRKDRRWSRNEITHWLKFSSSPVENDSPFRNMN